MAYLLFAVFAFASVCKLFLLSLFVVVVISLFFSVLTQEYFTADYLNKFCVFFYIFAQTTSLVVVVIIVFLLLAPSVTKTLQIRTDLLAAAKTIIAYCKGNETRRAAMAYT